jgi:hypothetical protein
VRDSAALCVSPSTRVANYSHAGVTGLFEFRLSANAGLDAASDDVDFTRGVPPPLQFLFYTVRRHASPICVCAHVHMCWGWGWVWG